MVIYKIKYLPIGTTHWSNTWTEFDPIHIKQNSKGEWLFYWNKGWHFARQSVYNELRLRGSLKNIYVYLYEVM